MNSGIRTAGLLGIVSSLGLALSAGTVTVGKTGAAYTTITQGITAAAPGDTVVVLAGTYNELINLNKSITLTTSAGAIISGTGLSTKSDSSGTFIGNAGLVKITASNATLSGFEICNFATTSSKDVPAGIRIAGGLSHVLVQTCKVHDIKTSEASSSYNAHGICCYGESTTADTDINIVGCQVYSCKLGQSETVVVNGNVNGFTIANNVIHDNDNIGIDAIGYEGTCPTASLDTARNGWVFGNNVYNINDNVNKSYPKNDNSADGIYVDGGNHILIERNIVDNCNIGIETAAEHGGKATDSVTIRNNFVSRSSWTNFAMGGYNAYKSSGDDGNGKATNIALVNNTSYGGAAAEVTIQYTVQTALIANNIFYAASGMPYLDEIGTGDTGITVKNNMYYGASSTSAGSLTDSAPFFQNPLLAGPYANLHLLSTSPAINKGASLGNAVAGSLPTADTWAAAQGLSISSAQSGALDIDGQARVQGTAIDIGADENE